MRNRNITNRQREQAKIRARKMRTTKIIAPDNTKIEVDVLMKPVLTHLWNRGVQTHFSCAGHFPGYKAHIQTERNDDFESYVIKSTWKHETRPIVKINPEKFGEVTPLRRGGKGVFIPANVAVDTGRVLFSVYAHEDREGYSRKNRCRFLRWLLEY